MRTVYMYRLYSAVCTVACEVVCTAVRTVCTLKRFWKNYFEPRSYSSADAATAL